MPGVIFSRFVIIESIPEREHKTGKQLYEALAAAAAENNRLITVEHYSTPSKSELFERLGRIRGDAESKGDIPLLHFEAHGNDNGLGLANGDYVLFAELYEQLQPINVATQLNVFVSVAACEGVNLGKMLIPTERAPFLNLLGPKGKLYPDELYRGFYAFYHTLISTADGNSALYALKGQNEKGPPLILIDAPRLFEITYRRYFERFCTPDKYQKRVAEIQEALQELGRHDVDDALIHQRLTLSESGDFDKFWKKYFMVDLYPANAGRFPIAFESVRRPVPNEEGTAGK